MGDVSVDEQFAALDGFIESGGDPWEVVATEMQFLGHPVDAEAAIREALHRI